jgi:phage antirepressor YoqD-like protein
MNLMLVNTKEQTMTSKEMAELTEKRHDSVKRTIENLASTGVIGQPQIVDGEKAGNNVVEKLYLFGKRDSYVIVAQLSPLFTARLVDRWQELESRESSVDGFEIPKTFAEALRLAADQQETIAKQALQIETNAPKVAFAEAIRATEGVCSVEKIAKTLGWGRNKFFDRLRTDGILMANNLPYQKYIDREYFTVIEQEPYTDSKGVVHPTFTTRVTGAGQVFLAKKYANIMGVV